MAVLNQAIIWIPVYEFEIELKPALDLAKYGAYGCLGLLVAAHVTYFFSENFVFEKTCRYVSEMIYIISSFKYRYIQQYHIIYISDRAGL